MSTNRKLSKCKVGDVVAIANNVGEWRVEEFRRVRTNPLNKDTLRRHPERLRSKVLARLRNLNSGHIKSVWFAELIDTVVMERV